jgi:hypothetical protein
MCPSPAGAPTASQKPVVAAPVPSGYNTKIYSIVKQLVKEGKDPTSQELSDLFRLMEYDSPCGELKDEARAIWREMRSRGIVPNLDGYLALIKVQNPNRKRVRD